MKNQYTKEELLTLLKDVEDTLNADYDSGGLSFQELNDLKTIRWEVMCELGGCDNDDMF